MSKRNKFLRLCHQWRCCEKREGLEHECASSSLRFPFLWLESRFQNSVIIFSPNLEKMLFSVLRKFNFIFQNLEKTFIWTLVFTRKCADPVLFWTGEAVSKSASSIIWRCKRLRLISINVLPDLASKFSSNFCALVAAFR